MQYHRLLAYMRLPLCFIRILVDNEHRDFVKAFTIYEKDNAEIYRSDKTEVYYHHRREVCPQTKAGNRRFLVTFYLTSQQGEQVPIYTLGFNRIYWNFIFSQDNNSFFLFEKIPCIKCGLHWLNKQKNEVKLD